MENKAIKTAGEDVAKSKMMVKQAQQAAAKVVEQAATLRKLGQVVIQKTIEAGSAYLDLCLYIRKEALPPKLITFELLNLGFHKARVSEIVKVAHSTDAIFSEFQARTIGFRKTLELTRGTVQQLLSNETGDSVVEIEAEVEEITVIEKDKERVSDTEEQKARKVENSAKFLLQYGQDNNLRSKTWTLSEGWTLTLSRDKDYKQIAAKKKAAFETGLARFKKLLPLKGKWSQDDAGFMTVFEHDNRAYLLENKIIGKAAVVAMTPEKLAELDAKAAGAAA